MSTAPAASGSAAAGSVPTASAASDSAASTSSASASSTAARRCPSASADSCSAAASASAACLRPLGLFERGELLLRRQLLALRRDDEADLGDDVGEHLERHGVAADALDRVHLELAAVDAKLLLLPEPVGDVRRGDRAEERTRRAGVDVEAELDALDPLGDRVRLVDRLRLVPRALRIALLELLHEPGGRDLGEPAREEEVARVAARDVHHVAAQAEGVDVLRENDVHGLLVADVRQKCELTGALDRDRDLALVAPARAADAA